MIHSKNGHSEKRELTALDSVGAINILLIPLIVSVVFLFGVLGFGLWAYSSRQDYKDNTDEKITAAVEVAKKETATEKDNEFIEREKRPLKDYQGPSAFGGVEISYPKTWAGYVDDSGRGGNGIDAYFHPNFVPATNSDTNFALRVQVSDRSFDTELERLETSVRQGKLTSRPFQPARVNGVTGMRFEGEVERDKQGILVLLPLRDKTLKIWTEAEQYRTDFESIILQEFTFEP